MRKEGSGKAILICIVIAAIIFVFVYKEMNALERISREEYEEGYEAGLKEGRSDGYSESYEEGSNSGYDLGYKAGVKDGYNEGYDDGYEKGYDNGYEAGYDDYYFKLHPGELPRIEGSLGNKGTNKNEAWITKDY